MTGSPVHPARDHGSGSPRGSRGLRALVGRLGWFLPIAALVVAADQWTKVLVRAHLEYGEVWPEGWWLIHLTRAENTGAAFGVFQGASGVLTIVALAAVAGIAVALLALPVRSRVYTVALSGILGGALGNLIDRVRLGAVTDFIEPTHYPAFNVADSAIVVSVAALLLMAWFERSAPDADAAEPDAATEGSR